MIVFNESTHAKMYLRHNANDLFNIFHVFLKQIDVSFSCVCPVIDYEFRHNIVEVAVDPRGDSQVDPQTTLTLL